MEPNSLWAKVIGGLHYENSLRGSSWAYRSSGGVWKCIEKSSIELGKINILKEEIIRREAGSGDWKSDFAEDGYFSVALLRNRIERSPHQICDGLFNWIKSTPYKVSCFVWRARLNRVPSAKALCDRGVRVETMCGGCINMEESTDHALVSCPFAKHVWSLVMLWCGAGDSTFHNVSFLNFHLDEI